MPIDPTRPSSDFTTYTRERADIIKRGTLDFSSSLFKSAVFASSFSPPEPSAPQYGVLDFAPKYLYYTGMDIDEFTVECFFNYTGGGGIFNFRTDTMYSVCYVQVFDRKIRIYNAGVGYSNPVSVNPNTWYYLAISRSNSTIYITLNGVTTELGDDQIGYTGNTLLIGSDGSPEDLFDPFGGVISNFRLVKRALYTQVGTTDIPARPLGNIADTDLLLLANNGSLYDSSDEHRVAIGTCRTSNGILDFRQYLLYRELNPGTSDFTVECFFKYYTGEYAWAFNGDGNQRVALRVRYGQAWLRGEFDGFIGEVSPNNWYHCAITRSGDDWYGTLNGFTTKIATDQAVDLDGWNLSIAGKYYFERLWDQFDGVIANFRYVKRALYNTETVYPIPTIPLTSIANTELLLVARSDAPLADSSGNGRVAESICNWVQDSIVPPTVDYGILTGFELTTSVVWYPDFSIAGDFTVEFFVKSSTILPQALFAFSKPNYQDFIYLRIESSGELSFNSSSGRSYEVGYISPNVWYHVAISRYGSQWFTSIDGITQSAISMNLDLATTRLCIGDYSGPVEDNQPFIYGSISNFRISNYARYTESYTVPSVPMQPSNTDLLLLLAKPEAPFADSAIPPREAKVSTTQCEWAPGPIQFSNPGYAGYYMKIDTPDYIGFNPKNIPGTSFTLEWFMRTNDPITGRQDLLEIGSGGYPNNAYVYVYINDTGMQIESNWFPNLPEALAPTTRTWSHYAITFTSTETKVFFNGKKVLTGGTCGTWINVCEFYFGVGFDFALYSTSIRLSNTVLYTTDFTPTLPLTANTSVKFLVDKEVPDDWDRKGDVTTLIGPIEIGSS